MLRAILMLVSTGYCVEFCVVTKTLKNCWYNNMGDCRKEAAQMGGACIVYEEEPTPTQHYAPQYLPLPPRESSQPFVGSKFGEATSEGLKDAQPFIDAIQQEQENSRKQREYDAKIAKMEAETRLLEEQAEYYRSQRESRKIHDLEWAERILDDSEASKTDHQTACRIYLKEKKFTGFDPDAFLCEHDQ